MSQKIVKFFDKHRFILVVVCILLVVIIFFGVNCYLFFHKNFLEYKCSTSIDDNYCYYGDVKILKDPLGYKDKIFLEYENTLEEFIKKYNLPEFNMYTAYYYSLAGKMEYNITHANESLFVFFESYVNTYDLLEFYKKYNFYFEIFYPYKII